MGDFEKASEAAREALRIEPNSANGYVNLGYTYAASGRLDEAQQTIDQGLKLFPNSENTHWSAYWVALATGKQNVAERELTWAKGKPGEYRFLRLEAQASLDEGKLRQARELIQRALEVERNQNLKEVESDDLGLLALVQADFGACDRARPDAATLNNKPTRDGSVFAANVFASCGDAAKAEATAAGLAKKYPLETFCQRSEIPQIRARVELQRGNGAKAVELLQPAEAYQFGYIEAGIPAYLRGLAYLQMKRGQLAAAEFQKILDHRSALGATPYLSLAKLGLARANALSGDSAKARIAYQDFFTLWKDADGDIPILKSAKSDYAKLQ
jgi:tetratricopeptide (TPR) repeat protein